MDEQLRLRSREDVLPQARATFCNSFGLLWKTASVPEWTKHPFKDGPKNYKPRRLTTSSESSPVSFSTTLLRPLSTTSSVNSCLVCTPPGGRT